MLRYLVPFPVLPVALTFVLVAAFLPATSLAESREDDAEETRQQRPLEVADILRVRVLNGDPAFHPFEDLVALTISRRSDAPPKRSMSHFLDNIDERGVPYFYDAARIVVVDLSKGSLRPIGSELARSWSPVWSPDGSTLAYLSDADGVTTIHTWSRDGEQSIRLALPAVPIGSGRRLQPVWLSDSRHIIVAARSASLPVEGGTVLDYGPYLDGRKVFTSPGSAGVDGNAAGPMQWSRADLVMVSLEGHETRRLAEGLNIIGFWVSPDGRRVAIEETLGAAPASQRLRSGLVFLDLEDGSLRRLPGELPGDYTSMSGAWSADGECFVHLKAGTVMKTCAAGGSLDSNAVDTIAKVDSLIEDDRHGSSLVGLAHDGGGRSQLVDIDAQRGTASELASSGQYIFLDLVARSAGGESSGGTAPLVLARDNGTQEAVILQIGEAGRLDEVFRDRAAFSSTHARWAAGGQAFFAFLESSDGPPDIWRLDVSGAQRQNLSVLNDPLDNRSFAEPVLLRASQGPSRSQGVLLVPRQWRPGVSCPLIVRPYGNQRATNLLYRFGLNNQAVDNMQLLASRGYAVLVPALPLEPGEPLDSIREHVDALVDAAVSKGIADPERLGVFGHSFGGYAAIGLATGSSPVFRSTVVTAPVGLNLFSYYGFMDEISSSVFIGWTEEGQSNVGANPWSDPMRLLSNSPLLQVDRIQGPVLIVLGEADSPRVPQSDELYVALRRLGSGAEYRIYQREPHWPGWWSQENTGDYLSRVLSWFDGTLGNSADGKGDAGQNFTNPCR